MKPNEAIAAAIRLSGMPRADLARALDVTPQAITGYLETENLGTATVERIIHAMRCETGTCDAGWWVCLATDFELPPGAVC